ncbi:MAG: hypothetical protein R2824_09850 [Saprospiraceae bacterium]
MRTIIRVAGKNYRTIQYVFAPFQVGRIEPDEEYLGYKYREISPGNWS